MENLETLQWSPLMFLKILVPFEYPDDCFPTDKQSPLKRSQFRLCWTPNTN
jgi:hypothetical protein